MTKVLLTLWICKDNIGFSFMIKFKFVVALLIVFSSSSNATLVYGAGNHSCGVWNEERLIEGDFYHGLVFWVQGYITGASLAFNALSLTGAKVEDTDNEGVEAFITKYCQENPIKKIDSASYDLILELISNKK